MMKQEYSDQLRGEIKKLPAPPSKTIFPCNALPGAIKIFFLVFISTFPIIIPFIFIQDVFVATRVSNIVALVPLFITGYYFGKRTCYKPFVTGLMMMMGIGVLLVATK